MTPTLALCGAESAGDVLLSAAEDSTITLDSGRANMNFGGSNPLELYPDNTGQRRALLKFSVPALQPGEAVERAVLYFYQENDHSGQSISAHQVTSTWSEMTVTWNTGPSHQASAFSSITAQNANHCIRAMEVPAALVTGWMDGSIPNNGVLLFASGSDGEIRITSREELINPGRRPQLSIWMR